MLNKDEYNQEEYNDYYRQETQGAELNDSDNDESGGIGGKLIGLLLIVALAIAGYFGYNMMSKSDDNLDSSLQVSMDTLPQSVQDETETQNSDEPVKESTEAIEETPTANNNGTSPKKEEVPEEKTIQDEVSEKVQDAVDSSSKKISPEDVATIVAAVMKQINQEKSMTNETAPTVTKQDKELMTKLSTTEVDSVSADLEKALENINISENTHIDNTKKQVDVYNKVTVQNSNGTDSLSQLSAQISSEIEDATVSNTTTTNKEDKEYSSDIKKEVIARKKEMRIIVVKKGDTLGKLAKRAYGNVMEYKRIYKANPDITRPDRIYIGQKIRIPLD